MEAHVFANIVLPLIEDIDRDSAKTIQSNLNLSNGPSNGGVSAVVEAFFLNYQALGLSCTQIGDSGDVDACNGTLQEPMEATTITLISVGCVLVVLTIFAVVWLLRLKKRKDSAEDNPVFMESNGEMNHTDDLLTKTGEESTRAKMVDGEESPMIGKNGYQEVV